MNLSSYAYIFIMPLKLNIHAPFSIIDTKYNNKNLLLYIIISIKLLYRRYYGSKECL